MEKAIPLISIVDGKYVLEQQAQKFLSGLQKPLAVITVAGLYRTGKSYLLNRVILNRETGFGMSPTVNSCTKGLWIWPETIHATTSDGTTVNLLVVDTQGLGSFQQDSQHDTKVFTLAVLLSTCLIYNSFGCIDETAINQLGLVVGLSRKIQLDEFGEVGFPGFVWVVRDFCLLLQNSNGEEITAKEYLEKALTQQKGFSEDLQERNRIRNIITTLFTDRDCFTFPRPTPQKSSSQSLISLPLSELRTQFVQQMMSFRRRVLRNLKPKTINGVPIDGQMYIHMLTSYLKAINGGEVINIKSVWEYVAIRHSENVVERCVRELEGRVEAVRGRLPVGTEEIKAVLKEVKAEILGRVRREAMPENLDGDFGKVLQVWRGLKKRLLEDNLDGMHRAITSVLDKRSTVIRQRITSSQLSTFEQSYKQITTLSSPQLKHIPLQFQRKLLYQSGLHFLNLLKTKINLSTIERDQLKQVHKCYIQQLKKQIQMQQRKHQQAMLKLQTNNTNLQCQLETVRVTLEICEKQRKQSHQVKKKYIEQTQAKYIVKIEDMKHREKQAMEGFQKIKKQMMIKENEYETERLLIEQQAAFTENMLKQANAKILELETKLSKLSVTTKQELKQYESTTEKSLKGQVQQISQLKDLLREKESEISILNDTVQNIRTIQTTKIKKIEQQLAHERLARKNQTNIASQIEMWKLKEKIAKQQCLTYKTKYQMIEASRSKGSEQLRVEKNTLERQNAVLQQELEFTKAELKELKEKYSELAKTKETVLEVSQPAPTINIDEILENHRLQIKQLEQKSRFTIKKLNQEIQILRRSKNQVELSLVLTKKQSSGTISQLQGYVQSSKSIIRELQSKINSSDTNKQAFMEKYKGYYESKIQKLEQEIQILREKSLGNKPTDDVEKELIQIKNYHEQEKMLLERKLMEQKQKSSKALKQALESLKKNQELELQELQQNQQMIQFQYKQMQATCTQKINQMEKQLQLQQLQITNKNGKIHQLQQQCKQLQQRLKAQAEKKEQQLKVLVKQLEEKNQKLKIEVCSYENSQVGLKETITSLESQIADLNSNMERQLAKNQSDIAHLNEALTNSKSKYQQFYDESFSKVTQLEKNFALSEQSNKFNQGKIKELQSTIRLQRKNLEGRIDQVRKQLQQQNKDRIDQLNTQLDKVTAKYTQLKKSSKQTQNSLQKQLNEARGLSEVYMQKCRQLQTRTLQLQKQNTHEEEKFKQSLIEVRNQTLDQRQKYLAEIHRLEDEMIKIETEKGNIEGNYEKDKILWSSKMSFLEQQKEQMKQDSIDKVRRLEDTIEFLQRSKPDRGFSNLPEAFSSIQRTYQLKLMEANDAYLKKQLQLIQKVRALEAQLKSQQQKNIKQTLKGSSQGIQRALFESRQSQKRLSQQIQRLRQQKQQLRLDHRKAFTTQRQQSKNKLKDLQQKTRQIQNKRSLLLLEHQRQLAKWHQQKQLLKQSNKQLEQQLNNLKSNNRKLEKQNQDFRVDKKKHKLTNSLGNSMMRSQFKFDRFKAETYKNYSIFGSPAAHSEYSEGSSQIEKEESVKIDEEE